MAEYYCENSVDRHIRANYFPDFEYKGIMVEVGGGHPTLFSSSKHWKDSGWRCIIFEPNPFLYDLHLKDGSEAYNLACGEKIENDVDFEIVPEAWHGMSYSSFKVKYDFINPEFEVQKIKVNAVTLNSFFNEKNIQHVDILSIDTEGYELEVMKGLDTDKIYCNYIVLENLRNDANYDAYMTGIGYEKISHHHYDSIYKKDKQD